MLKLAAARPQPGARPIPAPSPDYLEIPAVVRWSFIAFAGALPFEAADLSFTSFSLAKLSGLLFLACYLFFYNPISGKRPLPPGSSALGWFLVYLLVFSANGLFLDPYYRRQFFSIFTTLTQLLLLFWISSSLLRVEMLARRTLLAFAFGAAFCAIGTVLGVPGFATVIESSIGERVTAMDANPNYLAYTMALAAVALVNTALDGRVQYLWSKVALLSMVLPLLAVIVRSGSRTAILAFAIGFGICSILPNRQSGGRKMALFLALFIVGAVTFLVIQHPTLLTRFQEGYSGNLAGRQVIVPASLEMISERPALGWQPVVYWEELGRRTGQIWGAKDAHNLIFHLMLEVGLLGSLPFFVGLGLCAFGAWKARNGRFGYLPFALLAMTLSSNLTHTYLTRKPQWLVLAFAVAAASAVPRAVAARFLIRHPLRPSRRGAGHVFPAGARQRQY